MRAHYNENDPKTAVWLRQLPVEPAFQPLAYGVPARVVRLRGCGNAINVYQAAAFVAAYMRSECDAMDQREAADAEG